MGSGSDDSRVQTAAAAADDEAGGTPDPSTETRILLFMQSSRDRSLLEAALNDRYIVETATDTEALDTPFDCCVFGIDELAQVAPAVRERRERAEPVFLPFVLLVGRRSGQSPVEDVWEYVDDVIELPVQKAALRSRIGNLVARRRTSRRLADRERRLAETVDELTLNQRAMDEAPVGITLAAVGDGRDNPLIYMNDGFKQLTGYGSEALGQDCRFLQGPDTDPETVATIREAIDTKTPVSVDIRNYRANGQRFWNRLTIAPIRDETGAVTHFVGFQTDITDRKIRERRLEVMGRVLNHNLRNKMNLIEGYTDLLRHTLVDHEVDDDVYEQPLDVISETAADLMGIAESAQTINSTLDESDARVSTALTEELPAMAATLRSQYPNATVTVSLPEAPITVTVSGLLAAIKEATRNAIKHNDASNPSVEIRVVQPNEDWVEVMIIDDGPGIPEHETAVLDDGETPLSHAERLGIWLMYWVVNKAGGEFTVDSSTDGTTIRLAVPVDP